MTALDTVTLNRLQRLIDGKNSLGLVMLDSDHLGPIGDQRRQALAEFCEQNGLHGKTYEVNDETVVRRPRADEAVGMEIVEKW